MATSISRHPTVLVVGASRGLGLSVAELLHRGTSNLAQANVVSLSRSKSAELARLETIEKGRIDEDAVRLIVVQGDATSSEDCQKAVQKAVEQFGRLDAVVLNAGVIEFARLADVTPASFARQMEINLTSLVTTLHYAVPHLRTSPTGCGKVVFVSSGAAIGQTAGWGAYNAGKAAGNAIMRTLANEEDSLAVWAIRPGVVDTDMQTNIRNDSSAKGAMLPKEYERFQTMHAEGKLLKPHQPGHVLAALAVRGTRSDPKGTNKEERGKDSEGVGASGAFLNWDAEEFASFQYPN